MSAFHKHIYRVLLFLYPLSFRRQFGQEMTDVFCEQMRDAVSAQGAVGALSVWYCVASEILQTALSSHMALVGVSAISFLGSLGMFCFLFWSMTH